MLAIGPSPVLADNNAGPDKEVMTEHMPNVGRYGESAAVDPAKFKFSTAEVELWMEDHLHNIDKPARLYYAFNKSGSFEEGFSDSVYLDILDINKDGTKNASLKFMSGAREQHFAHAGNLTHITGNPVLGVYLQGDVNEMNRLTEGSWRYFQKRIKLALAKTAKVDPTRFEFEGKKIEGEVITLIPYAKDPRRRRFEKFADKRYEITLSDSVPGTLYQIKTIVPDGNGKEPLIEEILTLQHVEFRDR